MTRLGSSSRPEAMEKLIEEGIFTRLNRPMAFKTMEARHLIRRTTDKGPDSNALKFYLADPDPSAALPR